MNAVTFIAGFVFGSGLLLSGMARPEKVLAFLDIAGHWDPSLVLVMAGAIGVAILPFQFAGRVQASGDAGRAGSSSGNEIDAQLVLGSVIFGIGWGLGGFCPGPAVVGLGSGYVPAVVFMIAMIYGIEIYFWLEESARKKRLKKT